MINRRYLHQQHVSMRHSSLLHHHLIIFLPLINIIYYTYIHSLPTYLTYLRYHIPCLIDWLIDWLPWLMGWGWEESYLSAPPDQEVRVWTSTPVWGCSSSRQRGLQGLNYFMVPQEVEGQRDFSMHHASRTMWSKGAYYLREELWDFGSALCLVFQVTMKEVFNVEM